MLSAGFKFICCSTEDDADNPKITWHENLLGMENLEIRHKEINNQVTMTILAGYNELNQNRVDKSQEAIGKGLGVKKYKGLASSLYSLSKASGIKVYDFYN
jgi:hypothetical protein